MTRAKAKKPVTCVGGDGHVWELCDADGVTCYEGQKITLKGESWWLTGGAAPKHGGSSGKVWVTARDGRLDREFYPQVFNLRWKRVLESLS